jgi:hypothetical protein
MSGPYGSSQIPVVLGQHPSRSLVTVNIFFCRNHYIPQYRSRGARHRCLPQLWWWLLPEIPAAPPGAYHRCLPQLRWWLLLKILTAPPPRGGPPSMCYSTSVVAAAGLQPAPSGGPPLTSYSTSVVAAARLRPAPPTGPTIDVFFNFGGGYCRTSARTPRGPPLTSSSTSVVAATGLRPAPPKGGRHRR